MTRLLTLAALLSLTLPLEAQGIWVWGKQIGLGDRTDSLVTWLSQTYDIRQNGNHWTLDHRMVDERVSIFAEDGRITFIAKIQQSDNPSVQSVLLMLAYQEASVGGTCTTRPQLVGDGSTRMFAGYSTSCGPFQLDFTFGTRSENSTSQPSIIILRLDGSLR